MRIQPPDNPAKELARLDALRRAKLGPLYGKFWVAPGVRSPSEFNEQGLWEPLPPKKPPESVRFARDEERLKKTIGAESLVPRRLEACQEPPAMLASTASQYINSDSSASGKWPRDLVPWFQSSDLPDHLRTTVLAMLERDRHGTQLWMCMTRLAVELGVCRRTAQRRVQRLTELKVLEKTIEANQYPFPDTRPDYFRPSATYKAHPEAVAERPSWKDFEGMRPTHRRLKVKSATQHRRKKASVVSISPPTAPEPAAPASTPTPQAAAPVPVAPTESPYRVPNVTEHAARFEEARRGGDPHRSTQRKFRQLRTSDGKAVVSKILQLQKGVDGYKSAEGFWVKYPPGHPQIQAPQSPDSALIAACGELRLPLDASQHYAERCGIKFEGTNKGPGP